MESYIYLMVMLVSCILVLSATPALGRLTNELDHPRTQSHGDNCGWKTNDKYYGDCLDVDPPLFCVHVGNSGNSQKKCEYCDCNTHGQCRIDTDERLTCDCLGTAIGPLCKQCPADHTCTGYKKLCHVFDNNDDYTCICEFGYSLDANDDCIEDAGNPCEGITCNDHGTCNIDTGCECDDGYSGENCAIYICDSNPCYNDGECSHDGPDGYTCSCPQGYYGGRCENNVCDSSICQNGGTCDTTTGACTCTSAYTGDNCEIALLCSSNPCKNGATCVCGGPGGYQCTCPPGFSGPDCEIGETSCSACNSCKKVVKVTVELE